MNEETLELIESPYIAIEGEGKWIGRREVFIRTAVCMVGCQYCDSSYTFGRGKKMSYREIWNIIEPMNPTWIHLTGGEPTIWAKEYKGFIDYIHGELEKYHIKFHLITSGAYYNVAVQRLLLSVDDVTVDYKLKSAKTKMPTRDDVIYDASLHHQDGGVELKTVLQNSSDWAEIEEIAKKWPELDFTVQPVYKLDAPSRPERAYSEIAEEFLSKAEKYQNLRFLPQWHKLIFPNKQSGI